MWHGWVQRGERVGSGDRVGDAELWEDVAGVYGVTVGGMRFWVGASGQLRVG